MKDTSPMTGGADESRTGGTTSGLAEPPDEQDELHDGGLDLYDIDAEY
ncbi:hypothetical protein ACTXO9_18130 [Brachybacterium tyrofermentans]